MIRKQHQINSCNRNKFHTKVSLKVDPTESNWLAPFRISHMTSADILDVIDVFNNNCSSINIERKAYATASKALLNSLNEYPTTLEVFFYKFYYVDTRFNNNYL